MSCVVLPVASEVLEALAIEEERNKFQTCLPVVVVIFRHRSLFSPIGFSEEGRRWRRRYAVMSSTCPTRLEPRRNKRGRHISYVNKPVQLRSHSFLPRGKRTKR
eukprot:Nitzschia sp. Nitz4//scaffold70_size99833//83867//84175//NITZ4_004609-RA/size99833-exonerate_est2genome-gene-0.75-mRNA-1//-1//CDS//3329557179//6359//frame0